MPSLKTVTFQLTRFGNDALNGLLQRPLDSLIIYHQNRDGKSFLNDGAVPILSQMTSLQVLETNHQLSATALEQIDEAVHLFYDN